RRRCGGYRSGWSRHWESRESRRAHGESAFRARRAMRARGQRSLAASRRTRTPPLPVSPDVSSVRFLRASFVAEILNLKLLHVAIVLGERLRELVRAVVAADEIQIVRIGRVDVRGQR